LAGTGTGDIAEMTESLADDEAAYAYVRMKLGNDEYSERVKFAFVVWAGEMIFSFTLGVLWFAPSILLFVPDQKVKGEVEIGFRGEFLGFEDFVVFDVTMWPE
jgi:hypothetical protein